MREHERGDDTEGWGWDVRRLGKGKIRLPGAAILMAYEARKRPAPDTTGWREIAPSPLTATALGYAHATVDDAVPSGPGICSFLC
jgi:hypothetical protein